MTSKNTYLDKLYPKRVTVYRTDVLMSYGARGCALEPDGDGTRETVTCLSRKSLQRMAFTVQNTEVNFASMVTLTYPAEYPENGKVIKVHLNRFLSWLRSRRAGDYVWFLEFQKRGAPHFHILVESDVTPMREDISKRWYKAVKSGDDKHLRAGTRTEKIRQADGARRYAAKYGAKKEQKTVPPRFSDVGRFWGASRGVKPVPVAEYDVWGASQDDIANIMDYVGWDYSDSLRERPLSVLYNAGKLFAGGNGSEVDRIFAGG